MMEKEKSLRVYISGPITGLDIDVARDCFNDAEIRLSEMGFHVVNPIDNGLPVSAEWSEHMKADIRMMLECNAIYMLKGWEKSNGAKLERHIAERLDYKIIEQIK